MAVPSPKKTHKTPVIISNCKAGLVKQTAESSTIRVLGVPYGGVDYLEGKDLQGEYFDSKTDYAMIKGTRTPMLAQGLSYYDHAYHELFGSDPIGTAKFMSENDQGQWWDIEIARSFNYHDFILRLAEKGVLGASSQPVQTSVEIDWETGHIKKWHTVEISLTPTPANPLAIAEVAKSLDDKALTAAFLKVYATPRPVYVKTVTVNVKEVPGLEDQEDEPALVSDDDSELPSDEDAESERSSDETELAEEAAEAALADEVAAAFEKPADAVTEEAPADPPADPTAAAEPAKALTLLAEIKTLLEAQAVQTDLLIKALDASTLRDAALLKSAVEIRKGIAVFAGEVAKSLKAEVKDAAAEIRQQSDAEREAEDIVAEVPPTKAHFRGHSSALPDNAPGRKAS